MEEDTTDENKEISNNDSQERGAEYIEALKELVDAVLGTREKFDRIIQLGRQDGLSNETIRRDIEYAFKGKLDDRTIRRNLPEELKRTYKSDIMSNLTRIQNNNPEDTIIPKAVIDTAVARIDDLPEHEFLKFQSNRKFPVEEELPGKSMVEPIPDFVAAAPVTDIELKPIPEELQQKLDEEIARSWRAENKIQELTKQLEKEMDTNYTLQNEIENLKKKPPKVNTGPYNPPGNDTETISALLLQRKDEEIEALKKQLQIIIPNAPRMPDKETIERLNSLSPGDHNVVAIPKQQVAIILVKHLSLLMAKRNRLNAEQLRNGETELARLDLDPDGKVSKVL